MEYLSNGIANNSTLTNLNLSNNIIGVKGAKILAPVIKNHTSIKTLNLSENEIGDEGLEYLLNGIANNSTLTNLDLSVNKIGDKGANSLGEVLKNNKTLTNLDLSVNKIGDKGANSLGEVLKNNKTLTNLDLSNNKIRDEGAIIFGEVLKNSKTITNLDLSNNRIGVEGAESLLTALQNNPTLTNLNLGNNRISTQLKGTIEELIKRNQKLPNDISNKLYKSFIEKDQFPTLSELERKLIKMSPKSCATIVTEFLDQELVSKEDKGKLVNHIKEFPDGLRILVSCLHSKEIVDQLALWKHITLGDVFSLKGVSKDFPTTLEETGIPNSQNARKITLANMPQDILTNILTLVQDDISLQPVAKNQTNQIMLMIVKRQTKQIMKHQQQV